VPGKPSWDCTEEQRNVYKAKNWRDGKKRKGEMRDLTPTMGEMLKETTPGKSRASC
jgi:hypothetical protein